jgi:thimet oligopeptidase
VATEFLTFSNREFMSAPVYKVLKDFQEKEVENLDEKQQYLLKRVLQDLLYSGCSLDEATFKVFKDLEARINVKITEFSQNIAKDITSLSCTEEELKGVSERLLATLPRQENGLFEVGIDYPTYMEVMRNCAVQETRARLYNIFMNRGYPVNEAVLLELITLRNELAVLLGFPDFAHLDLQDKMAGTPAKVSSFLDEIRDRVTVAAAEEFKELSRDLPDGVIIGEDGLLNPWDYEYLSNYYTKNYLDLDQNKVAEYFPLESTLQGVFVLYARMLGLKFEIVHPVSKGSDSKQFWHQDVRLIKASDASDGKILGYILLDLHPRVGKYTHACCGSLLAGVDNKIVKQLPVMFVLANFQKPGPEGAALLRHDEVKTFFHEFGHAMHNLLATTEYAYFSGTKVLLDFVEAPSQMFEEWMYSPQILKLISCHYLTGQPLPDEMIEGLQKQKNYLLGNFVTRQIRLALFSLKCYLSEPFASIKGLEESVALAIPSIYRFSKDAHFYASFGHLTGYASAYYSYLWSLVFAKDVWTEILRLGIVAPESGALIRNLLSAGGMMPPEDLLTKVLGRKPSTKAFEDFLIKK